MEKKIVYVDMDGVLADFQSAIETLPRETLQKNTTCISSLRPLGAILALGATNCTGSKNTSQN